MIISSQLSSYFFTIVLFCLLVIIARILCKELLLPAIHKQIQSIKKYWEDLKKKQTLLVSTKKRLNEKIKEQKHDLEKLNVKIQKWQDTTVSKIKEKQTEQENIATKVLMKKRIQSKNLQLTQINSKIFPTAIKKAREKLFAIYEEEKGKSLLHNSIENLNEE